MSQGVLLVSIINIYIVIEQKHSSRYEKLEVTYDIFVAVLHFLNFSRSGKHIKWSRRLQPHIQLCRQGPLKYLKWKSLGPCWSNYER